MRALVSERWARPTGDRTPITCAATGPRHPAGSVLRRLPELGRVSVRLLMSDLVRLARGGVGGGGPAMLTT